jgi:CheY-like chemotaxis protein
MSWKVLIDLVVDASPLCALQLYASRTHFTSVRRAALGSPRPAYKRLTRTFHKSAGVSTSSLRVYLEQQLADDGFEVLSTDRCTAALDLVEEMRPSLILLDAVLPDG